MIFSINYIVKLYSTPTMSTPSTPFAMKYKPNFPARKPLKDIKDVMENDGIILYHSQSPNLKPNTPLTGALSCNILFSSAGKVRPCSRKRRL